MGKITLDVGLVLSLEVPKEEGYVKTPVVGWETDRYFISKLPYIKDKPVKLKGKDTCLIRFLKEDTAFGFKAEVLSIQFFPAPLIFFKYPEQIESVAYRVCKRYKTNIPAKFLDANLVTAMSVVVMDISRKGCLLRMMTEKETPFEVDSIYYLTYTVVDRVMENIRCVVKNQFQRDDKWLVGVEFSNLSAEHEGVMDFMISLLDGH